MSHPSITPVIEAVVADFYKNWGNNMDSISGVTYLI